MKQTQNSNAQNPVPEKDHTPRFTFNKIAIQPSDELVVAYFSEKRTPHNYSVFRDQLPPAVSGLFPAAGNPGNNQLYVHFDPSGDLPFLQVPLSAYPAVARAWYSHQLCAYFKANKKYILSGNLINDLIVWLYESERDDKRCYCFSRTALWIDIVPDSTQLVLGVAFAGLSYILKENIMALSKSGNFPLSTVNRVIHNKRIFRIENLKTELQARHDTLYPVLNPELAQQLNIQLPFRKNKLKHADADERNRRFATNHLFTDAFRSIIPLAEDWLPVAKEAACRLPRFRHSYCFGNKHIAQDIRTGLLTHGPYKQVPVLQLNVFFIYHHSDTAMRNRLEVSLSGREGGKGLAAYTHLPVFFDKNSDLVFADRANPAKDVCRLINERSLVPGATYLAIYLSPHSKMTSDPNDHRAYYLIKEALLQRGIASQTIDTENLSSAGSSFRYWIPNIAMACIAKTGGIPWVLDNQPQDELIVGFGIYNSEKYHMKCVGTAVCFSNTGNFRAFDMFPLNESYMVAASLEKALKQYMQSHGQLKRLIIHYHKEVSKKVFAPVQKILDTFNPGIPVIIIHINSTQSGRFLVSDATTPSRLPLNGSYFALGRNRYILYVNEHFQPGDSVSETPLPVMLSLKTNQRGLLADKEYVSGLLAQVYDFSYLYWRSLRQLHYPVTMAYPALLASHMAWFSNITLPDLPITRSPWFL